MKKLSILVCFSVIVFASLAAVNTAGATAILDDGRYVAVSGSAGNNPFNEQENAVDALFDEGISGDDYGSHSSFAEATAMQKSTIGLTAFSAVGATSMKAMCWSITNSAQAEGASVFDVTFELFAPHAFAFTGNASGSGNNSFGLGLKNLADNSSVFDFLRGGDFSQGFNEAGVLQAGEYKLIADATSRGTCGGSNQGIEGANSYGINLDLEAQSVPEPATALLLVTGLVGLVGTGIRKKLM